MRIGTDKINHFNQLLEKSHQEQFQFIENQLSKKGIDTESKR